MNTTPDRQRLRFYYWFEDKINDPDRGRSQ